jgi:hypothetical protein
LLLQGFEQWLHLLLVTLMEPPWSFSFCQRCIVVLWHLHHSWSVIAIAMRDWMICLQWHIAL